MADHFSNMGEALRSRRSDGDLVLRLAAVEGLGDGRRSRFRVLELSIVNRKLPRDFVNVGFRDWRVKALERTVLYPREWTTLQRREAEASALAPFAAGAMRTRYAPP